MNAGLRDGTQEEWVMGIFSVLAKSLSKGFLGLVALCVLALFAPQSKAYWHRWGCAPMGFSYYGGFGPGGFGFGYRSFAFAPGFGYGSFYRPFWGGPYGFYGYRPFGFGYNYYSYPGFGFSPLAYGGVWAYRPGFAFSPVFLPNESRDPVEPEYLTLDKKNIVRKGDALAQIDQAIRDPRPNLLARPMISSSPLERGLVNLEQGNFGQATRELQKAVAAEPKSAKSRWLLAHSLWMTGKYKDASTQMRRVLDDPTVDTDKLAKESAFLVESPAWETSLERLRQARAAYPGDKSLILLEAISFQVGGKAEAASPLWRELSTDPTDQFTARRMLARTP